MIFIIIIKFIIVTFFKFIYFFDLFFSLFFCVQVVIFNFYPYRPVLFFKFFFKQLYQISNCATYVNLTVGNTWKHNVAFCLCCFVITAY